MFELVLVTGATSGLGEALCALLSDPGQIATPFAEKASQGLFTQRPSWSILTPRRAAEKIWKQSRDSKKRSSDRFPHPRRFELSQDFAPLSCSTDTAKKSV